MLKNCNMNKNKKMYSHIIENVIKRLIAEGVYYDEDIDPFEEYQKDYPNADFDVSDMTPERLAKWCSRVGDFLYIYRGMRGLSIMVANSDEIVRTIVDDLYNCLSIEPTHEVDYLFYLREHEFINDYVCVFKVNCADENNYYVVYQEDKLGNNIDIDESVKRQMNESIKSSTLKQWFNEHGGVKRLYDDEKYGNLIDKRVRQDGLGDVTDGDIIYTEEFGDENDAFEKMWQLKKPSRRGERSDLDMRAMFTVYKANDGSCLLVGLDRNTVETGPTWGGEMTKKTADRIRNNGWNFKTRNNRYVDDSDTYYYGGRGRYFGLKTNSDYKGKMKDNKRIKSQMSDDEWKDYQNKRVQVVKNNKNIF